MSKTDETFDLYGTPAKAKPQKGVLNFKVMFDDYVANHQKEWDHDRSLTLGASETFDCIRKAWFKKNDAPIDPDYEDSWGAAERGNVMENHWVVPVLRYYLPKVKAGLEFAGDDQVTFVADLNSATPDGLITGLPRDCLKDYGIDDIESDCLLIEMKSIDPRAGLDEEKEIHHGQAQVQMGILHRMGEYKPMYTVILYVNASFYDEVTPFFVKFDETAWRSAKVRAKMVFEAKDASKLPAEGKLTDACKRCQFVHACAKVSKELVPTGEKSTGDKKVLDTVFDLVQKERLLDEKIKNLQAEQKDLRTEIKEELTTSNSRKMSDDRFSVSWTFQGGRTSYDYKAMEKDGIDLEPYANEGAGFEKMTITLKSPAKSG